MSEKHAAAVSFELDIQKVVALLFPVLTFCALMALFCRGLLEVTIGKASAYGAQVGLWTLVQVSAVLVFRSKTTGFLTAGLVLTFVFGIVAAISSQITMDVAGFPYGLVATMVNIYLLLLFVAGYGFRTDAYSAKLVIKSMALSGLVLPVVAMVQLVGFANLPGDSPGRVPSVTGSYLHFPLLCGVLGICLLEGAKALNWRLLYPISLLCFLGVGISGGRSGTLVIMGAGILYLFFEFFRKPAAQKIKFAYHALAAVAVAAAMIAVAYQYSPTVQRIAQLGNLHERGNIFRIYDWIDIYNYWLASNLWFGEFTGLVGNTTSNLTSGTGAAAVVAESGALQQLINFGLLGLIFFYAAMLLTYRAIVKECTFLRALFIAGMVQTLFYQSTEVLPYMAMMAFLAPLSQTLLAAGGKRYSNQGR